MYSKRELKLELVNFWLTESIKHEIKCLDDMLLFIKSNEYKKASMLFNELVKHHIKMIDIDLTCCIGLSKESKDK